MVGRTKCKQKTLTISFWRDYECHDAAVTGTIDEAYAAAMRLLAKFRPLQPGDRLVVSGDDGDLPDDSLPEPHRSGHYSG